MEEKLQSKYYQFPQVPYQYLSRSEADKIHAVVPGFGTDPERTIPFVTLPQLVAYRIAIKSTSGITMVATSTTLGTVQAAEPVEMPPMWKRDP